MFELMENTDRLPVPEESIVQIHNGMNKVRVSVGNFVSEPSDVYIVSSRDGALLRSYIVFFIVEHGMHMIYGYSDNPYDPVLREEVLQEAVDFVEEMGTILEEIPWEKLSPEERRDWLASESIYPRESTEGLEEIVDLEEIEPEELQEVVDEKEYPVEKEDLLPENPEVETLEEDRVEVEAHGAKEIEGIGEETTDGEKEEDGDFDNLLKQAFLKPELVKKSRLRKSSALRGKTSEEEKKLADEERIPDDDEKPAMEDESVHAGRKVAGLDMAAEDTSDSLELEDEMDRTDVEVSEKELEAAGDEDDLSDLIQEINAEASLEKPAYTGGSQTGLTQDAGTKIRLKVIKYLSRF